MKLSRRKEGLLVFSKVAVGAIPHLEECHAMSSSVGLSVFVAAVRASRDNAPPYAGFNPSRAAKQGQAAG